MTWKSLAGARPGVIVRRIVLAAGLMTLAGANACDRGIETHSLILLHRVLRDPMTGAVTVEQDELTHAERGSTVEIQVTLDRAIIATSPRIDISEARETQAGIGDAVLPPWLHGTFEELAPADLNVPALQRIVLTIDESAPLGPVWFRGSRTEIDEEGEPDLYVFQILPFDIETSERAPAAGTVEPGTVVAGAVTPIEFPVFRLREPFQLVPSGDGISVLAAAYDAGTQSVRATLDVAADARSGERFLVLVNSDGARSRDIPIQVAAAREPPQLTGLFPNFARAGESVDVTVAGTALTEGTLLNEDGAEPQLVDVRDSHFFFARLRAPADVSAAPAEYSVTSVGGASDPSAPALLHAVSADASAPVLTRVVPDVLVTNSRSYVRLEGSNLGAPETLELVAIGSDAAEFPFASARLVPSSAPHDGFIVAELAVKPGDPAFSRGPTGGVRLALRRIGGPFPLTTATVPLQIVARREAPAPILSSADVGSIAQGADVVETLRGSRLGEVTQVLLESGGVQRVGDLVPGPGGNSIVVTLRAADDATLTGDAATNLVVVTRSGRSNPLAYAVTRGQPAGCADAPATGFDVTVTGAGLSARVHSTATVVPAFEGTGSKADVCSDEGCITLGIFGRTADYQVGPATTYIVKYADPFGANWISQGGQTVQIVRADEHSVAICIDDVPLTALGAQTPQEIRMTGTFVWAR